MVLLLDHSALWNRWLLVTSLLCALSGTACSGPGDATPPLPPESAEHVGRALCAECHQAETRAWAGSQHDRAMEPANESTVLGDFDDAEFTYAGVTSSFFRRGEKFMVRTDGADGRMTDYEIAYTFGVDPLQQYLIEFPGGRFQALNVCWDTRPAGDGGQRWFHLYPEEQVDYEDPLHWTGPLQNWNYMCSECHSTNVHKDYRAESDSYRTTWSEIDVSCEACHGPGSRHVDWARLIMKGDAPDLKNMGLELALSDRDDGGWIFPAGSASARREPPRVSRTQIETCARCHARRAQLTDEYRHGRPLADTHRVTLLDEQRYHADGQILDEVYVYGSFIQSAMYHNGVTCSDCHDPHSARLRAEGNATCSPCHNGNIFDTADHHHHSPGSTGASCVGCHMPQRTYMVVDPRRDHSLRIPRPDLSVKIGTPNACNDCHVDRTADWAVDAVTRWYDSERVEEPHYAEAIHAGRTWQVDASPRLLAVVRDPGVPAIARASALTLLKNYPTPDLIGAVRDSLRDESPLVRRAAAEALELFAADARSEAGLPLLDDPIRSVRIEAARALAGLPRDTLTTDGRGALERALEEYMDVQRFNGDRAENQLNMGSVYSQTERLDEAERAYRAALRTMPSFSPATINLVDLYRILGRDSEAEALLREALASAPDDGDLHHALGLLLVRQKRHDAAIEELDRATALLPRQPRYAYVLGVALHSLGRTARALGILKIAHERHPAHTDLLFMLAAVSRDSGELDAAKRYALQLLQLAPGHPGAAGLLTELDAAP